MEDKKYPIELEAITPLAVGAGNEKEWVKGIDFVQKEGKIYVLDLQKAMTLGIDVGRLSTLFLNYDEKGIIQLIGNQLENISKYIFNSPIRTDNNIKSFLRTQFFDKPVVAGSSLKGSIRSALFKHLRTNEKRNEDVFGTMRDGTDFMRFIRVSDIEMPSTILVNSKIFNLHGHGKDWQGGWKHGKTNKEGDSFTTGQYSPQGFNTLYECVEPGQKGLGSITLAANAYNLLEHSGYVNITHAESKRALIHAPINELFKAINKVTVAYLKKEKAFIEKYPAQRTDEIVTHIDYLLNLIPTDGSFCILKMSAGVGFHSITGDWQFDDYDNTDYWEEGRNSGKKKYKSRKIAEYNGNLQLMGFVKLRPLSENEAEDKSHLLQAQHQAIFEQILAPIRDSEAIRLRAKEEKEQMLAAQAAERKRREDYLHLLQEAQTLYDKEQWDDAIAKAQDAAKIGTGFTEHSSFIERCEKQKSLAQFKQEQVDDEIKKFQQPLANVLLGKNSVGNIVGTTAKWLKFDHTFGEPESQVLTASLKAMPKKDIKKKLKDLEKAIGKEWSDKIIQDLGIQ